MERLRRLTITIALCSVYSLLDCMTVMTSYFLMYVLHYRILLELHFDVSTIIINNIIVYYINNILYHIFEMNFLSTWIRSLIIKMFSKGIQDNITEKLTIRMYVYLKIQEGRLATSIFIHILYMYILPAVI